MKSKGRARNLNVDNSLKYCAKRSLPYDRDDYAQDNQSLPDRFMDGGWLKIVRAPAVSLYSCEDEFGLCRRDTWQLPELINGIT